VGIIGLFQENLTRYGRKSAVDTVFLAGNTGFKINQMSRSPCMASYKESHDFLSERVHSGDVFLFSPPQAGENMILCMLWFTRS